MGFHIGNGIFYSTPTFHFVPKGCLILIIACKGKDTDGKNYGYLPYLRAKIRSANVRDIDYNSVAEIETVSYCEEEKSGVPSSKKVAVIQPYYGIDTSFTTQYANEGKSIAQAIGGTNTTYIGSSATVDNIAYAMQTCGVVIFDSHGTTDVGDNTQYAASSYICLTSGTGITQADYDSYFIDEWGYQIPHVLEFDDGDFAVDGTIISNHMTSNAPNSLLWMAICLGMATDGLQRPLRNRGVEVVYGYSQSVPI